MATLFPISPSRAVTKVNLSYLPSGYGPNWIWRRLRIYLLAVTVAVVGFLFWRGLGGDRPENCIAAVLLAAVAILMFFQPLRTRGFVNLRRAYSAFAEPVQVVGAVLALSAMAVLAADVILHLRGYSLLIAMITHISPSIQMFPP